MKKFKHLQPHWSKVLSIIFLAYMLVSGVTTFASTDKKIKDQSCYSLSPQDCIKYSKYLKYFNTETYTSLGEKLNNTVSNIPTSFPVVKTNKTYTNVNSLASVGNLTETVKEGFNFIVNKVKKVIDVYNNEKPKVSNTTTQVTQEKFNKIPEQKSINNITSVAPKKAPTQKVIEKVIVPTTKVIYQTDPTILGRLESVERSILNNIYFSERQTDAIYKSMSRSLDNVAVNADDIGLGNVDNTSDLNKPISTATQAALDLKQPVGNYLTSYTETDPIFSAWDKATGIIITKSQISDFPTVLSSFTNDSGYLTSFTETDPTIYAWAKAAIKPSYTPSEIGLGNVTNESKATMFTNPSFTGQLSVGGAPSGELWGTTLRGDYSWTALDSLGDSTFELYSLAGTNEGQREMRLLNNTRLVGFDQNLVLDSRGSGKNILLQTRGLGGGNVGIGTTTPTMPLSIQSNSSGNTLSLIGRDNFGFDESTLYFKKYDGVTNNAYLQASSNGFGIMGGSVGVGVLSPRAKLAVGVGYASNESIIGQFASEGGSTDNATLYIGGGSANVPNRAGMKIYQTWNGSNTDYNLGLYTGTAGVGSSQRLTIDAGGNVGIGTSTPGHALDVLTGTVPGGIISLFKNSTNADTAFQVQNSVAAWQFSVRESTDSNPGGFNFYYSPDGSTSWVNSMNLSTNGNVSIPSGNLSVSGTVTGSNLSGTNTGDNAVNSNYANDYRSSNFVAGTNYLAPNGNGSSLTGLTATQVGLGNVTNESKTTMFTSPTFTGTTNTGDISITGSIIPSADDTYDLGSPTKMWRNLYVGAHSIYVNGQEVLQTDSSSNVVVSASDAQNLNFRTTGGGNIELNPASGGGQILLKSDITITAAKRIKSSDSSAVIFGDGISSLSGISATGAITGSNLSGTNTGDNAVNSNYANDYRSSNFVAGTNYLAPNGSAASLTNFPILNQNTTGTASNITAYTINQNLGTTSNPTFAGATLNGNTNILSNTNVELNISDGISSIHTQVNGNNPRMVLIDGRTSGRRMDIGYNSGAGIFSFFDDTSATNFLSFANTGAATFASNVTATGGLNVVGGSTTVGTTLLGVGTNVNNSVIKVVSPGNYAGAYNADGNAVLNIAAYTSGEQSYSIRARGGAIFAENVGNVGIGTTSPGYKLDVRGTVAVMNAGGDGTLGTAMIFGHPDFPATQNHRIRTSTSSGGTLNKFQIETSNGTVGEYNDNQLVLLGNGNVGIGTTTPLDLLEISKNNVGGLGGSLTITNFGGIGAGNSVQLGARLNYGFTSNVYSSRIVTSQATASNTDIDMSFYLYDGGANGGTEKMRIKNNGNVGIGTTSPDSLLRVYNSSSDAGIRVAYNNTSVNYFDAINQIFRSGSGGTEYMRISNGSVGIGTSSPNEKLDVQGGNIRNSALASSGNKCVYADSNGTLHISSDNCGLQGASGDNLGSHIASQNIQLAGYWLSNDGGNEGISVGNTGMVSISGTGPKLLQISPTTATSSVYTMWQNDVTHRSIVGNDNSTGDNIWASGGLPYAMSIGTIDTNPLTFATGNNVRMAILANGNVGIGTTTPTINGGGLNVYRAEQSGVRVSSNGGGGIEIGADASTNSYIQTVGNSDRGLNFYTGNAATLTMSLKSDGNVGIGTSSPTEKLQINYDSSVNAALRLVGTNTNSHSWYIGDNAGGIGVGKLGLYDIGNAARLVIDSAGNVGIGTTSPTHKLTVETSGSNSLQYSLSLRNPNAEDNGSTATGIIFGNEIDGYADGKGALVYTRTGGYGIGDFVFLQNSAVNSTNPTMSDAVFTIKNNGNVGIGTTSPTTKLAIQNSDASGYASTSYLSNDGTVTGIIGTGGASAALFPNTFYLDTNSSRSIAFAINDATKMFIQNDGNVGIGTTTPSEKLNVVGNILSTGSITASGIIRSNETNGFAIGGIAGYRRIQYGSDIAGYFSFLTDGNGFAGIYAGNIISSSGITAYGGLDLANYDIIRGGNATFSGTVTSPNVTVNGGTLNLANLGQDLTWGGWVNGRATISSDAAGFIVYPKGNTLTGGRMLLYGSGDIQGNISATGSGTFGGEVNVGSVLWIPNNQELRFKDTGGYGGLTMKVTNTNAGLIDLPNNNNLTINVGYQDNSSNALIFKVRGSLEAMRINNSGNVGIGITSPGAKLHVLSTANYGSVNDQIIAEGSASGGSASDPAYYGGIKFSGNGYDWGAIRTIQTSPASNWNNRLAFFTMNGDGGSVIERMAITNSGYVGIGTTSPTRLLTVSKSGAAITLQNWIGGTNGDKSMELGISDTSSWFGPVTANNLEFETGGTTKMTILNTGNVGIGTTSPGAKLAVINNVIVGAQGGGDTTYISGGSGYGSMVRLNYADGVANTLLTGNGDSYFNLNYGAVGIGTASPTEKLEIKGGNLQIDGVSGSAASMAYFNNGNHRAYIGKENSAGNWVFSTAVPAYSLVISNFGETAPIMLGHYGPELTIKNSGNVGIGTTDPQTKLDVVGNITFGSTSAFDLADDGTNGLLIENWNWNKDINLRVRPNGNILSALTVQGSTGNVGIGTTSPDAALHIATPLDGSGNSVTNRILEIGNHWGFGTDNNADLNISRNESGWKNSLTFLRANGYVGIGTTTPETKLHIQSGDAGAVALPAGALAVFESNTHTRLQLQSPDTYSPGIYFSSPSYPNSAFISNYAAAVGTANLQFAVDNSVIMTLKGDSVGIGTTSPGFKIDVNGTGHFSGNISIGTTYNGFPLNVAGNVYAIGGASYIDDGYGFQSAQATTGMWPNSAAGVIFKTAGSEKMRIDNSGNVGIGTTSPGYKMHIKGPNSTGLLKIESESGNYFIFGGLSGGTSYLYGYENNLQIGNNYSSGNLSLIAGNADRMWITSDGNVGIGTTGPAAKLEISSNHSQLRLKDIDGGGKHWDFSTSANTDLSLHFEENEPDYLGDVMYWKSNGNVGIGTTTPNAKLEVNGSIVGGNIYSGYAAFENSSALANNGFRAYDTFSGMYFENSYTSLTWKVNSTVNAMWLSADGDLSTFGSITTGANLNAPAGTVTAYGDISSSAGTIHAWNGLYTQYGDIETANGELVASGTRYSSDRTLKENIKDIDLEKFKNVKFYQFNFISDPNKTQRYGVIAQEVMEYAPELVKQNSAGKYTVNYNDLFVAKFALMDLVVKDLSSLDTTSATSLGTLITTFLGDINNQVGNLYASVIHSDKVETKMLCVGNTCVTEEQFLEIVNKNVSPSTPVQTEEPVVQKEEKPVISETPTEITEEPVVEETPEVPTVTTPVQEEPVVIENTVPVEQNEVITE